MMKWLAQRFQYTRNLENEARAYEIIVRDYGNDLIALGDELEYWKTRTSKFTKMTIEEIEEVLSACVDYQRCLIKLQSGDPIQHRVLPIFEKYDIKVERNTATDKVIEEAKEFLEKVREEER